MNLASEITPSVWAVHKETMFGNFIEVQRGGSLESLTLMKSPRVRFTQNMREIFRVTCDGRNVNWRVKDDDVTPIDHASWCYVNYFDGARANCILFQGGRFDAWMYNSPDATVAWKPSSFFPDKPIRVKHEEDIEEFV